MTAESNSVVRTAWKYVDPFYNKNPMMGVMATRGLKTVKVAADAKM